MTLWQRLLRGNEWSKLADLVSPTFFELVSARDISARIFEIARNWLDSAGFDQLIETRRASAERCQIPVDVSKRGREKRALAAGPVEGVDSGGTGSRVSPRVGDVALDLYFHQVFTDTRALLDFRAACFDLHDGGTMVRYQPTPIWVRWSSEFAMALRALYDGFYQNDDVVFRAALSGLGVAPAETVFRSAFGGEHRRQYLFTLADFKATFHQVFVACREKGSRIHPDFITLGVALATLYGHLERTGHSFDVEACYERGSCRAAREIGVAVESGRK